MGSQEGCHRKVWTNLSISGNPDNSEGVGGDRPGGNQDHRTGQEVLTRVMNSYITGGGGDRGVWVTGEHNRQRSRDPLVI